MFFGLRLCGKKIKTDRARVGAAEAFDVEMESLLFIPVKNLMYEKQEDVFIKTDGKIKVKAMAIIPIFPSFSYTLKF